MQSVRAITLIPRGFSADDTVNVCDGMLIAIRSKSVASPCPACGGLSTRVHSRYTRRLSDLPMAWRRNQRYGFQAMIRGKSLADMDPWLERARSSLVASFANGVTNDKVAVCAAISSAWSNGQTEGQITKLKLVKRQMYGRGKLDLLQARVIGAV